MIEVFIGDFIGVFIGVFIVVFREGGIGDFVGDLIVIFVVSMIIEESVGRGVGIRGWWELIVW